MSTSDNDELEHDLSAWEAPEPPADLADLVLRQLGNTDVTAAIPIEPRSGKRRTVVIAGIAAACLVASASTYALIAGMRREAPTSGDVIADRARTLSLDGVGADLDPGSVVQWERRDGVLHVKQRAGAAAWRVDEDTKLVIDAGATLASVEATGASLRVEVEMNGMDARVIGASALTAAAVSLVTVTVYTGHVRVTDSGRQTVVVAGATHTVAPPPVPAKPEPPVVGATLQDVPTNFDFSSTPEADVRIPALESPTIHAATLPVKVQIGDQPDCELSIDTAVVAGIVATLDVGLHDYTLACGNDHRSGRLTVVLDGAERSVEAPAQTVNKIAADGRVYRISYAAMPPIIEVSGGNGQTLNIAEGTVSLPLSITARIIRRDPDGRIKPGALSPGTYTYWYSADKVSTLILMPDPSAPVAYVWPLQQIADPLTVSGSVIEGSTLAIGGIAVPIAAGGRFSAQVSAPGEALALRVTHPHRGLHYFVLRPQKLHVKKTSTVASAAIGLDRAMISKAMAELRPTLPTCVALSTASGKVKVRVTVKPDGSVGDVGIADTYDGAVGTCVRDLVQAVRFPVTDKGGSFTYPFVFTGSAASTTFKPCDPEAFKEKGMTHLNRGEYGASHAQFEFSLQCKDDPYVRQLAFMTACSAKNVAKSAHYYKLLTPAQQTKFIPICTRNGIDPTVGALACDAKAHKDKGFEAINLGQHAAAVAAFEASYKCGPDETLPQIIAAQACAAKNIDRALYWYAKLSGTQKAKVLDICEAEGVKVQPPPTGDQTHGFLNIHSKPAAKILVDGNDTGLTTPVTGQKLRLTAGKHKITFVVGNDRFTYPVVITAGKSEVVSKDLE